MLFDEYYIAKCGKFLCHLHFICRNYFMLPLLIFLLFFPATASLQHNGNKITRLQISKNTTLNFFYIYIEFLPASI